MNEWGRGSGVKPRWERPAAAVIHLKGQQRLGFAIIFFYHVMGCRSHLKRNTALLQKASHSELLIYLKRDRLYPKLEIHPLHLHEDQVMRPDVYAWYDHMSFGGVSS